MAMQLRLTDGVDTVMLSGDGGVMRGCTYFPSPGDPATQAPVAETSDVVMAGTRETIVAAVNRIERLFTWARNRTQRGTGRRVFVEYLAHSGDVFYRSEIFDGRVMGPSEPALRRLDDPSPRMRCGVAWTRQYFWEGPEAELPLSNATSAGVAATGGRVIYNRPDTNWIEVAAGVVKGTLPAPLRIVLENNSGAAQQYRNFYLAVNATNNPQAFFHGVETEFVVPGYGTVSASGQVGYSGGAYVSRNVAGATEMQWTLLSSLLQQAGGRYFRVLARMVSSSPTKVYARLLLRDYNGLQVLTMQDNEVLLPTTGSSALVDLGVLPLPPGGDGVVWGDQRLCLQLRAAAAVTVNIDYLQLTPLDSYRYIQQPGYQIPNTWKIVDDGIVNRTYVCDATNVVVPNAAHPFYYGRGSALQVFPGLLQRIFILQDKAGTCDVQDTFSVRAYYRPRRLTI